MHLAFPREHKAAGLQGKMAPFNSDEIIQLIHKGSKLFYKKKRLNFFLG